MQGRFLTARRWVYAGLIAVYAILPFWWIDGERAVLFDIGRGRFFLFGLRFNAQDVWLTTLVLLGIGFALIYVTTFLGRVWCGWACPQTVFLEGVFRRIERLVAGKRGQRRGPRQVLAHVLYAAVSLGLAALFLRYFSTSFSWLAVPVGAALYANFGWFREQTCVVVCPYGRLQSVLLDDDSLVVGYDARRGEPRGKVGMAGAGACVDCKRCVAVCPTGIDIRHGLQLDCIACTACIDACDDVMVKLHRAPGLIRYDSTRGLRGEPRRILRPRVVVSTAIFAALILATAVAAARRTDFEANLLRLTGAPYALENDEITNRYEVHLVNKRATAATFAIAPTRVGAGRVVVGQPLVELEPFADRHVPIIVSVPRAGYAGPFEIGFLVVVGAERRALTAPFLGPPVHR